MTNKKQTAVEQLMSNVLGLTLQLSNNRISQRTCELKMLELFEQAKQMEKQQIKDAWFDGYGGSAHSEDEYYNEKYNI